MGGEVDQEEAGSREEGKEEEGGVLTAGDGRHACCAVMLNCVYAALVFLPCAPTQTLWVFHVFYCFSRNGFRQP